MTAIMRVFVAAATFLLVVIRGDATCVPIAAAEVSGSGMSASGHVQPFSNTKLPEFRRSYGLIFKRSQQTSNLSLHLAESVARRSGEYSPRLLSAELAIVHVKVASYFFSGRSLDGHLCWILAYPRGTYVLYVIVDARIGRFPLAPRLRM
jgi:hypothetical protein